MTFLEFRNRVNFAKDDRDLSAANFRLQIEMARITLLLSPCSDVLKANKKSELADF